MPRLSFILSLCLTLLLPAAPAARSNAEPSAAATQGPAAAPSPDAPIVTKVEPPNWWLNLTSDLMLLLSGHHLEATRVTCNLATLHISRTQASAGGDYLFIWLKIAPEARSGTAICRVTTPTGETSFDLPISARTPTLGKFQGLNAQDVLYLIMPDRFANGDPSNDEPKDRAANSNARDEKKSAPTFDRTKPRAYHGGDLRGIREHLFYLQELGVTTLWLTPIVKNGAAESYHGYSAVDLYAVDPHLGTLSEYCDLVAEAHRQKLKIFFDIVPNHVGPLHPWVNDPPLPDWFHGTAQHHLNSGSPVDGTFYGRTDGAKNNDLFETLADPHAPPRLSRNLTDGWFFGVLPDLNTENPIVAKYLLQNAIWWAETSGLDGFRVDTFPYVSRQFWSAWNSSLHASYPYLTTVGEVFHPDPRVTSFFVGGHRGWDGIDSGVSTVFDFPTYFTLRDILLHGASAGKLPDILRQDALYPHPENLIAFFANHDVPRFASAEGSSIAKLKLAFGLTLTLRGIPELYYGDEIAMPGAGDPDNRRDFPGGWTGDRFNAFLPTGRSTQQQEVFSYVQSLLKLRREHPALKEGRLTHLASDASTYVFLRDTEEEHIVVAFNNAEDPRTLRIPTADSPLQRLAGAASLFGEGAASFDGTNLLLNLPPQSITIFALD